MINSAVCMEKITTPQLAHATRQNHMASAAPDMMLIRLVISPPLPPLIECLRNTTPL